MCNQCASCQDTGVVVTNTLELGDPVIKSNCDCKIGRAATAPLIGPRPGTSHELSELAIDLHHREMTAEGRRQCWICSDYHVTGTECPNKHPDGSFVSNIGDVRAPQRNTVYVPEAKDRA